MKVTSTGSRIHMEVVPVPGFPLPAIVALATAAFGTVKTF